MKLTLEISQSATDAVKPSSVVEELSAEEVVAASICDMFSDEIVTFSEEEKEKLMLGGAPLQELRRSGPFNPL